RLSVTRICFLADEKPESRPPESTSFTFMLPQPMAFRYHIPNRLQSRESEGHRSDSPRKKERKKGAAGSRRSCIQLPGGGGGGVSRLRRLMTMTATIRAIAITRAATAATTYGAPPAPGVVGSWSS